MNLGEAERRLANPEVGDDPYKLLLLLGREGGPRYRRTVESFLQCEDDPMLARLALLILCRYWSMYDEYRSEILQFSRGVVWDDEDDVRVLALACAGHLGREGDVEALRLLARVFRQASESWVIRDIAYRALETAFGRDSSEQPPASRRLTSDDLDPEVVAWAVSLVSDDGRP
ncbi:MAG: hypothetical protein AAF690_27865 [Acidobacteriota bacterium]